MKTKNEYIEKWAEYFKKQSEEEYESLYKNLPNFYHLTEGIDIDTDNLVVSFNDTHEDNVDTSLNGNPTVDKKTIPGVPIWSIFKRKRGEDSLGDGNPLVYALKNERNWKFNSKEDRKAILNQFSSIADKFLETHTYDVTLIVPSSNPLNNFIADTIISKDPSIEKIEGYVCKISIYDVYEIVLQKDSKFRKTYSKNGKFKQAFSALSQYLKTMANTKNGDFTRHLVLDQKMRNTIDRTLKLSDEAIAEDANKINDRDVLIIDDVVSRGQTIKEMVKLLKKSYSPKSITVLTLLSKLY